MLRLRGLTLKQWQNKETQESGFSREKEETKECKSRKVTAAADACE
jgi:hypothetical protein